MMIKNFVYRLYPSMAQAKRCAATLETCRRFYNDCLAERKTAYTEHATLINKWDQFRGIKILRMTNPWAKAVCSHTLQVVVSDLDKAFQAFFRCLKAGEQPGYPRFKSKPRFRSFGFKDQEHGFKIQGRRLRLYGIGRVAVRWHRPLEGTIKTLRIIQQAGKWFACFSCLIEARPLPPTGQELA